METLVNVTEKAKERSKVTFDNLKLKERINDFSDGWRYITDKAKKEAKTVNKRAKKVLNTFEEGGPVRYEQIYNCNLNAGYEICKRFEKYWEELHAETDQIAKKTEIVDEQINNIMKDWQKWNSVVISLHDNLAAIPDIVTKIEMAKNEIRSIGEQAEKLDRLMLEYDNLCDRVEMEKKKEEQRMTLSMFVEKRQMEYSSQKEEYERTEEKSQEIERQLERQDSCEKQQVYEDAFLEQMNRYSKFGELERPISGSVSHDHTLDEETMAFAESDFDALKEFLGPEELNTVLRSQAALATSSELLNDNKDSANIQITKDVKSPSKEIGPMACDSDSDSGALKSENGVGEESEPSGDNAEEKEDIKTCIAQEKDEMNTCIASGDSEKEDEFFDADDESK